MSTERFDQQLACLLATAEPVPELRPGWEQRAMAAMAAVAVARPKRVPRLVTVIVVTLLLLILAGAVFAAVRYLFIEGTLSFDSTVGPWPGGPPGQSSRLLSGELEWSTEQVSADGADLVPVEGVPSPATGELAFETAVDWPPTFSDIWKTDPDGSEVVNLTARAELGGVNCYPQWSPDGSMIAFQHCDPVEGVVPCEAGFHLWVISADGSEARPVLPEDTPGTMWGRWSPDGSRLLCNMSLEGTDETRYDVAVTTDPWGTDIQVLPNVGNRPTWSPDGTMIASTREREGELDGVSGAWNQLVVTGADGSDPEVLVQQFIVDAEVNSFLSGGEEFLGTPGFDWEGDLCAWVGPRQPEWSPNGDRIAFLAAMPWDPEGPYYKFQIEVWVYDLNTDELIQVTDDDLAQTHLSWK